MFNGRISEIGVLLETGRRLLVRAPKTVGSLAVGGSVCVSGTCLSAVEIGEDWFATDMSEETAHRSTLAEHPVGAGLNLELPLRIGDSLDGHLVQGHTDAVGKVTAIDDTVGGRRLWIRPPPIHGRGGGEGLCRRGRSELDRGGGAPGPLLRGAYPDHPARDHSRIAPGRQRVNLESDLFVKSARELHAAAGLVASRSFAALPWAGELRGVAGVEKTAAQLAAGGAVIIYDPDREAEADVVFAGAGLRPESFVFLLTQVCGHTTVPCDRERLDRLEIPPMPGGRRPSRHRLPRLGGPGRRYGYMCIGVRPGRNGASADRRARPPRGLPAPGPRLSAGWKIPWPGRAPWPHRSLIGTVPSRGASNSGGHLRGDGAGRSDAGWVGRGTLRPTLGNPDDLDRRTGDPPVSTGCERNSNAAL